MNKENNITDEELNKLLKELNVEKYPTINNEGVDNIQNNKIIINGRGGAGKDTVADYLVDKYGFTKIAFADPIYDIAKKYFGMTIKDRKLLQQIGEKFREIESLVWVNHAMAKVKQFDKVVVSDCRRKNEYNVAVENGFLPIRINADFIVRAERIKNRDGIFVEAALLENNSEIGADACDFLEINNNGDFEELYQLIDWVMEQKWDDYLLRIQKHI